ncbi:MAG: peptidoglycan-binding protein [Candidatus Omnitrophica bacterium]|nr:peptidoglycan-binding protein [Candidatus Omnitrophota bacterium]
MRLNFLLLCVFFLMLILVLGGCATASKSDMADLQVQQLRTRVGSLESQLERKNAEVGYLSERLDDTQDELERTRLELAKEKEKKVLFFNNKTSQNVKNENPKPTPVQIQKALQKAKFYEGPIDGKIGKNTQKAIMDFQRANNLKSDGIVGKETWTKLSSYYE